MIGAALMVNAIAANRGKQAVPFSRFNFVRAKERGNTHFCFHCIGCRHGFTPGPNGEALNGADGDHDPMKDHDPVTHADGIVGDVEKFSDAFDWIENAKFPVKFPFVVHIPSIW